MIRVRPGTLDDVAEILPRVRALNAEENIEIDDVSLEAALRRLLGDPSLGSVWLALDERVIGHAVVTYGFDLELGGRDAFLTELWIDEDQRRRGAGTAREQDVRALHLQVRSDNPAARLYERVGFMRSPRVVMTRRL